MGGQRVIVAFRGAGRPEPGSDALQGRLDEIAAAAGSSGLQWHRRLATGADLAFAPAELDTSGMSRLLEAARARPDVEYAEADAMMSIAAGGGMQKSIG